MSFGDRVKAEIISKPYKEKHCQLAFLSGLIRGSGVLFEKDGEFGFEFKISDENTAMLVSEYLYSCFNYEVREISARQDSSNKKDKFVITLIGDIAIEILLKLCILQKDGENLYLSSTYPSQILYKECCEKSFIKGLFVSSGSCTVPGKENSTTSYHLQISCSHSSFAGIISDILLKNKIHVKISRNKEKFLVYLKSAEEIKDFIAYLSAPVSVLKLTDLMVERDFTNGVNRRKNCDLGNVNRQLEAFYKQISAIEKIKKSKGLDFLKPDLLTVANARIDNPEDSIIDLAKKLGLTKSCLNHRLRKLIEISNEI